MFSLKHLASFPGNLKEDKAVETVNQIQVDEGLLPHPLLVNLSDDVLIISDEVTKRVLEAYRMKKVLKCKCVDGGKELGKVMILSTSKANGKTLATHVFKASDELLEMAAEEINFIKKKLGKKSLFGKLRKQ